MYYSKCLLAAYQSGQQPLELISNAGYQTGSQGYESISLQASGVASVAGVSLSGVSVSLSQLTGLHIDVEADSVGSEALALKASASYDSGYTKDVSDALVITGYDPALGANQSVQVSYTENDVTIAGSVDLSAASTDLMDTAALAALLEKAQQTPLQLYTSQSVQRLEAAMAAVKAFLDQPGSPEVYGQVFRELKEALDVLQAKGNLARGMSVQASCAQSSAAKITDGTVSLSNYWASTDSNGNVDAKDASFVIDMDGVIDADAVRVYPYWGGTRNYQYELYGSMDGQAWSKIAEKRDDAPATSAGDLHLLQDGCIFRYLKLQGVHTTVQGRDDINNIHIVEVQVFGTERANLAYLKPVRSSGTDTSAASSASSREAQIVDGDRSTYWDGGSYANRPWVEVDLEKENWIESINVVTYWMRTDKRYYHYEIETSLDGQTYTPVYAKTEGTDPSTAAGETITFEQPVLARYVRLIGTYNSANSAFHCNELRVYGHEKADKRLLKLAIDTAHSLTLPENLNSLVRTTFEARLSKAEAVHEQEDASQQAVNEAWTELCAVIHMSNFVSDKSELSVLIARAALIDPDRIAEGESKTEFLDALEYAAQVMEDPNALSEDSIARAVSRLQQAMDNLEWITEEFDTAMLELLVDTTKDADPAKYVPAGWNAFEAACTTAVQVLENPQSQQQIDEAAAALHEAWLNLRLKADESLLASLRAFVSWKEQSDLSVLDASLAARIEQLGSTVAQALENPKAIEAEQAKAWAAEAASLQKQAAARLQAKNPAGQKNAAKTAARAGSVKTAADLESLPFAILAAAAGAALLVLKKRIH